MDKERQQTLYEQEKLKDWIALPATRIVAEKLRKVAREAALKQMRTDPFKEPEKIVQAQQLRYVINILIPQIVEGIVNYDPDAPDKQVAPKDKWSMWSWLVKKFTPSISSKK